MKKLLFVLAFTIPWEFALMMNSVTVTRALIAILFAVSVILIVAKGKVVTWNNCHALFLLYATWLFSSLLWSISRDATILYASKILLLGIMCFLIWQFITEKKDIITLIQSYVWGCFIVMIGVAHIAMSGPAYFFGDDNARLLRIYSVIMCTAMPMAFYLWQNGHKKKTNLLYMIVAPLSIFLTYSRTAMVMVLVFMVFVSYKAMFNRQAWIKLPPLIVVLSILTYVFIPLGVYERAATIASQIQNMDMAGRGVIWKAGLEAFLENPIFGYGAGTYRDVALQSGEAFSSHNAFIGTLVESGIIGLLLFSVLLFAIWIQTKWLPSKEKFMCRIVLTMWFLSANTLSLDDYTHTWFIFSLVLIIARAVQRKQYITT